MGHSSPVTLAGVKVHIVLADAEPKVAAIYRRLADAIIEGTLPSRARLPSTRELARDLGISRNTVAAAYDRLLAEGLIEARVGAGTFVAAVEPRVRRPAVRSAGALVPSPTVRSLLPELAPEVTAQARPPARYDFAIGVPDARLFPAAEWRREVAHRLRPSARLESDYGDPGGAPALRTAIARHIGLNRAVKVQPDEIIVTHGAQHAISLVGRALLSPGDIVAVEDPGYPPIRALFASLGARVVPVPVDDEGIRVDRLPARAALIYTTPSHQFPLGMPMSFRRRQHLLAWAEAHRAAIVEDDYDAEFRFGARPLDALHSLDRVGRVIYVGTFSKSLVPSLRLGFVVVPPSLAEGVRLVRRVSDWSADPVPQEALAALLDSGAFAAAVRRARRVYERRHAALGAALALELSAELIAVPSHAGLHLAARLQAGVPRSAARIVERAAELGVRVRSIDEFFAGPPAIGGLVLGFGRIDEADIPAGVRLLAQAVST